MEKSLMIVLSLLVAVLFASTVFIMLKIESNEFRVGECVREVSHSTVERITAVTSSGIIETEYRDIVGTYRIAVYNIDNQDYLTNVSCADLFKPSKKVTLDTIKNFISGINSIK